jgi:hypothetical protein
VISGNLREKTNLQFERPDIVGAGSLLEIFGLNIVYVIYVFKFDF